MGVTDLACAVSCCCAAIHVVAGCAFLEDKVASIFRIQYSYCNHGSYKVLIYSDLSWLSSVVLVELLLTMRNTYESAAFPCDGARIEGVYIVYSVSFSCSCSCRTSTGVRTRIESNLYLVLNKQSGPDNGS